MNKLLPLGIVLGMCLTTVGQSQQVYYGNYDNQASTVGESYARGLSNVISSAGSYNLQTSQANINNQQATSQYLDNRLKATQTYFEMRRINTEARAAENPRLSADAYARMARQAAPDRLHSSELDPITGVIDWPYLLRDPRFADVRSQLDGLFQARASSAGLSAKEYSGIQKSCQEMKELLKGGIREFNPTDYAGSRSFIDSLAFESRFPPS